MKNYASLFFILLSLTLVSVADTVHLQSGTTAKVPGAYEKEPFRKANESLWKDPKSRSTIKFIEKQGSKAQRQFYTAQSEALREERHREVFIRGADSAFVASETQNDRYSGYKLRALIGDQTLEVRFVFRGKSGVKKQRRIVDRVVDTLKIGNEQSPYSGQENPDAVGDLRQTFAQLNESYESFSSKAFRHSKDISMSVAFDINRLSESIYYTPMSDTSPWLTKSFVKELKERYRGQGSYRKTKLKNKIFWVNKKMKIVLIQRHNRDGDIRGVSAMTFAKYKKQVYNGNEKALEDIK